MSFGDIEVERKNCNLCFSVNLFGGMEECVMKRE